MRIRAFLFLACLLAAPSALRAEDFTIEPLKQAAPKELDAAVGAELSSTGYRVNKDGKPFAEFWWRKATPASTKPSGPNGPILFPILKEGELLGALRYVTEGQDYRDQGIAAGVYTLRYGLQPVNGDHLGVSPFRDYALLLPAAKDKTVALLTKKVQEERSAEAAGTSHPAVLMFVTPPESAKKAPSMAFDETKQTWGAVVSLPLAIKGADSTAINVQLIVSGAAQP